MPYPNLHATNGIFEDDDNSVEVANRFIAVGEVLEEIVEAEDPTVGHHSKQSLGKQICRMTSSLKM